jgi:hypothetical protein
MPPRSVKTVIDEEQALASAVGRMITVTPEREEQMEAALWDLALGHAVLLPYAAKPPSGVEIETISVYDRDGEAKEIRVYLRPPDSAMLKLLIEQNVGRPGSRLAKEHEQVICVMHAVPAWNEEEEDVQYVGEVTAAPALISDEEVNPWPSRG